jgi:hypothetical protein
LIYGFRILCAFEEKSIITQFLLQDKIWKLIAKIKKKNLEFLMKNMNADENCQENFETFQKK